MTPSILSTPPAIVTSLRARGARLWVEFEADGTPKPKLDPAAMLTPEDWSTIKADREAVIAYLVAEQQFMEDGAMDFFQMLQRCGLKLVESSPGHLSIDPPEAENQLDRERINGLVATLLALVRDVNRPLPVGVPEKVNQQDQRRSSDGGALRLVASGGVRS